MVVITGVDVNNNIVYSNNPWDVEGEQSYDEFLDGFATGWLQDNHDWPLRGIYIP